MPKTKEEILECKESKEACKTCPDLGECVKVKNQEFIKELILEQHSCG